jgi:hypothetical protein
VAGLRVEKRSLAALVSPLLSIVLAVAIANSALRTLARGGVRWRGTLYPLDALRKARTSGANELIGSSHSTGRPSRSPAAPSRSAP